MLLLGPGGVGKTSVGHAVSGLLSESDRTAAFVDLDSISQFGPRPPHWSSYEPLRGQNLGALWVSRVLHSITKSRSCPRIKMPLIPLIWKTFSSRMTGRSQR
jgi:hypothetical protein